MRWREQVAAERRAAFRNEVYWGRPVPGFGDPKARLVLLGLAPAAHGGNRTGRVFTGDRSGDFLFEAMWRVGLSSTATSSRRGDGLELRGAWVTAAVRCAPPANKPTAEERDNCLPWTERELSLLPEARVILCLGGFAWDAALRLRARLERGRSAAVDGGMEAGGATATAGTGAGGAAAAAPPAGRRPPRPKFAHGAVAPGSPLTLVGCYHPSQQNTFTGRLTKPMLEEVLAQSMGIAGLGVHPPR